MRTETVIEHWSQLDALRTIPFLRKRSAGTVRLGGEMPRHENWDRWQRELNRTYHACGCDAGARGMLAGLVAGIIAMAASGESCLSWHAAGIVVASAFGAAIIGKMIGLTRAQARLRRTIREIADAVRPHESQALDTASCG